MAAATLRPSVSPPPQDRSIITMSVAFRSIHGRKPKRVKTRSLWQIKFGLKYSFYADGKPKRQRAVAATRPPFSSAVTTRI